jgi:hypothetical protein
MISYLNWRYYNLHKNKQFISNIIVLLGQAEGGEDVGPLHRNLLLQHALATHVT